MGDLYLSGALNGRLGAPHPRRPLFSHCGRAGARWHPAGGRARPSRAPTSAAQRKIVSCGRTQLRVSCRQPPRSLPQHGRTTSRSAALGGAPRRGVACTVVPHALCRRRARCGAELSISARSTCAEGGLWALMKLGGRTSGTQSSLMMKGSTRQSALEAGPLQQNQVQVVLHHLRFFILLSPQI
jgi:hypothetical protein